MIALLFIGTFCLSMITPAFIRPFLLKLSIIDTPNNRSSHTLPTPTGGGVNFIMNFGISLWLSNYLFGYSNGLLTRLYFVALLVAIIGLCDDLWGLKRRLRISMQFMAAILGMCLLEEMPQIQCFTLMWPWLIFPIFTFYLVWLLNLYNFMDGINGLAAVEAISVLLSGALLSYSVLGNQDWIFMSLLAASCLGFLVWNFPQARLFMGDAGSCYLGLMIGFISIDQGIKNASLFYAWLILLGVFIVDATFTLSRRFFSGKVFYEAHRSHSYQYASRLFGSHTPVTLIVLIVNVFYLLPLAYAVTANLISGIGAVCIAYAPLLCLAYYLKAGDESRQVNC